MLLVLVGIGIALTFAGLVAAPIVVYRARVLPHLARRRAGPAAYAVAALPVILAFALGAWLLRGWFVGWPGVYPGPVALALLLLLLVVADSDLLNWLSRDRRPEDHLASPPDTRSVPRLLALLAMVVFAAVAVPLSLRPIEDGWGCAGVELALPAEAPATLGEPLPLETVLASQPEPGALLIQWASYDLESAADSRHDPRSHQQLTDAGFVGGARWGWETADGAYITADVFEFRDPKGAMRYQRIVNRYACGWANPFAGPRDGVGLQIERQEGWVEDQISWVSGARRYRVSVFHTSPPLDHGRVLAVAGRMEAGSEQ